jgi:hypothetical protein
MSRLRRYRALPVEVEAVRWAGNVDDLPHEWLELDFVTVDEGVAVVRTLEGLSTARLGDYIVRGVVGEIYPVKGPIFRAKYQPVEGIEP